MRIVAGVDVGNATTEVVLVDASLDPPLPLAWDRAPTRGVKGSAAAARAAVTLVRRLETACGHRVEQVCLAPQRPVTTRADVRRAAEVGTGPVRLVACGATTPGRPGLGVGRPVPLEAAPVTGTPVVLLVAGGTGHLATVAAVRRWLAAGAEVAAVVLADDEGVLVSHRLPEPAQRGMPVLDGVDVEALRSARRAVVEVAPPGRTVRVGIDPLQLLRLLGCDDDADRRAVAEVARAAADQPQAVVAHYPDAPTPTPDDAIAQPDDARAEPAPAGGERSDLEQSDLGWSELEQSELGRWSVDLAELAESVELRRDPGRRLPVVSARLAEATETDSESGSDIAVSAFRQAFSTGRPDGPGPVGAAVPVARVVGDEAAAALAGALSTPGARPDAVVLDLGAGTLDAVTCAATDVGAVAETATATVAGGGALVTLAVAELLQVPLGAAEWAKRGPCERVENPLLVLGEDGSRRFVERALPAATVGSLVAPGPAGPLPFTRTLSPAEWRSLRLRVKRELLGRNVSRCLQALGASTADVLLVGGVAGDDELLRILDLPARRLVGRADVAGRLGHRWAVAYGLTLLGLHEGTD